MTSSKLVNYTTREFMSDHELEQYIVKQNEIFTPKVIEEFTKAGMLRRVLTKLWNKEGVHRVGILFEYRDEKAYVSCQSLLEKHYIPMVKTFITKVVVSVPSSKDVVLFILATSPNLVPTLACWKPELDTKFDEK